MRHLRLVGPLLLLSASALAVELRNDGFESGMSAGFQGGFCPGEIAAARLIPTGGTSYRVNNVTFLFGGASGTRTITLDLYDDSAGTVSPGAPLHSDDYEVTGADDAFSQIDLSASAITGTGPFRVGIELTATGFPSVARDSEGAGQTYPERNFLDAYEGTCTTPLGWQMSPALIVRDWVIRADVSVMGGGAADGGTSNPDGGTSNPDGGTGDPCNVNSECPPGMYCD